MHRQRIEQRRLYASTELVGYTDWPGLAQTRYPVRLSVVKILDITTNFLHRENPDARCSALDGTGFPVYDPVVDARGSRTMLSTTTIITTTTTTPGWPGGESA